MKSKYIKLTIVCAFSGLFTACTLNYDPVSAPTELTQGKQTDTTTAVLKDSAAASSQRTVLYQSLKDGQEYGYEDLLLLADAHSDNAYGGTTGAEVVPFETNSIDASSSVLSRDWDSYMTNISQANVLINGIDPLLTEGKITQADHDQWKAEGKIYRAMMMFEMARIWGSFPIITTIAKTITSGNIKEVYPTYYPPKSTAKECYAQIISDLTDALNSAPNFNQTNKTLLSKTVAEAMLAKVYAEKPVQDYSKVIQYADMVRATPGLQLDSNYSDLFGYNAAAKDCQARNTPESILEYQYTSGNGNWVTWMFGRQLDNYDYYFTWAKWVTPSRDLINAFDQEGDTVRKNQSIVYYTCTWSNYYPADHYPFMYKIRSSVNSIIKLRLADILLLEAEAYTYQSNLSGALALVNQIRERAKVPDLASSDVSTQSSMLSAVLNERRLELCFEGQRWFDLCRNGLVESVMNAVYSKDSGRLSQVNKFNSNSYLMPIPQTALDENSNLTQNPGY
jgi:starch-binding outer membrane protein, SusD/RagB family